MGKLQWAQTGRVLAMLYNANRSPDSPAADAEGADFNPYAAGLPRRPRPDTVVCVTDDFSFMKPKER